MKPTIENESVPLRIDESGVVRIGRTRVLLDLVIEAFNSGVSAEEIADIYPSLQLAEVYYVIGYYLKHRRELDTYLQERARRAEEMRKLIQERNEQSGIKERLLSQRNGNDNSQ
ncbi:MAG TPA: DUF433 domain-containing protein [Chloroflexia bacterium]|nr:DUF433 domain-containing protein [Chloroflexia bacterium]